MAADPAFCILQLCYPRARRYNWVFCHVRRAAAAACVAATSAGICAIVVGERAGRRFALGCHRFCRAFFSGRDECADAADRCSVARCIFACRCRHCRRRYSPPSRRRWRWQLRCRRRMRRRCGIPDERLLRLQHLRQEQQSSQQTRQRMNHNSLLYEQHRFAQWAAKRSAVAGCAALASTPASAPSSAPASAPSPAPAAAPTPAPAPAHAHVDVRDGTVVGWGALPAAVLFEFNSKSLGRGLSGGGGDGGGGGNGAGGGGNLLLLQPSQLRSD